MKISIVVLNYGTPDLTLQCLESIDRADHRSDLEIILVDNGSDIESRKSLESGLREKAIRLDRMIELPANAGFSCGMNAGIAVASGDLVVALNSDTIVGKQFSSLLLQQPADDGDLVAFYAVSLFDLDRCEATSIKTRRLQADVAALTWYMSCMPVRADEIQPAYVLGPAGPAVIMTRRFIREMIARDGFVYDPKFFLYGEDVDLFLRARRSGFSTRVLNATIDRDEVIWHVGSATASNAGVRTLDKSPEVAARVLKGCLRNVWRHAGWLELLPALLLQVCFRIIFCARYTMKHSRRSLWQLALAGLSGDKYGRSGRRAFGLFLLPLVALLYRKPFPWARGQVVTLSGIAPVV